MLTRSIMFVCLLAFGCGLTACSGQEDAQRYLESGNRYFAEQKYEEAIIEYRNALQINDQFGEARYRLAEALAATGNEDAAYREYARAADLMPTSEEVQLKAATVLFLAGKFEDVKTRTQRILDRNPNSVEAQILLANALAGLRDMDAALTQLDEAIRLDPSSAPAQTNLGMLRMAQRQKDAARDAFERAVQLNPKSIQAWLALANFQWSIGTLELTEESLTRALSIDPKNLLANRAMATLYASTNRMPMAEPFVKTVAEVLPGGAGQLMLADYYIGLRRSDEARTILEPLAKEDRTFAEAQVRLAGIGYDQGDVERATALIDDLLKRAPGYAPALVIKARRLAAMGNVLEALERATEAVNASPPNIESLYLLGTIQSANGLLDEATRSFNDVLRMNPRAAAAQIQLAHIRLIRRDAVEAVALADQAVRNVAGSPQARITLARGLIASRDMIRAQFEVTRLLKDYPMSSSVHALNGTLKLLGGEPAAARAAYEQAARLDPRSIASLTGLTMLDLQQNRAPMALARLDARIAREPNRAEVLLLAAKVQVAERDLAKAERTLRRILQINPATSEAYGILVDVYREQNRLEPARLDFDSIAAANARDVGARTMAALLLHAQNRLPEARQRYTDILASEPRAAVAANNLAWILADAAENLDLAVQLAERAVEQLPDRAEIRDTLGWVYYRKQLPQLAIAPFEQAIAQEPGNATFHYHLGLAHVKAGDRVRGKGAFEKALSLDPNLADAKRELAYLQ